MVMVFTVVSAAMEWLGSKWEAVKEAREEREKEKKERIEAEERVSYLVLNNVHSFNSPFMQ